jgi:hypothetical protein
MTAAKAIDKLPDVLERKEAGRPRFDSRSRIIAILTKPGSEKATETLKPTSMTQRNTVGGIG